MRIAVIGSTGGTGRQVVIQALERGHEVVALARRPEALADLAHERLEVRAADVTDEDSLVRALRGVDTVVSALGVVRMREMFSEVRLYSEGGRKIVSAMEKLGLKRLLVVTSGGVEDHDPSYEWFYARILRPFLLRRAYDDMKRLEQLLSETSLDWTVARPTQLTDDPRTGQYRVSPRLSPPGGTRIARADLAHFMLEAIEGTSWLHGTPTIAY